MDIFLYISFPLIYYLRLMLMKTINLVTTLLFCIIFINISSAQTVKQQQTNKKNSVKGIKLISNIKNDNLLKVEKDVTSTHKNTDEVKQKQIISKSNKQSSKIKMIKPTTVTPNTTKTKVEESKKYKLEYQKGIKTKEVEDE